MHSRSDNLAGNATHGRPKVLVVDDDATVRKVVTDYLDAAGLTAVEAGDGLAALELAETVDLIVLDLMLPKLDGLNVVRRLRDAAIHVPVIMLTAKGDAEDRILGLELGAYDYVTKPFSARELVLRVQSVLRRTEPVEQPEVTVLQDRELEVNLVARTATLAGEPVPLSLREFDLLAFFMTYPGRVFSRDELLHEVWGWGFGDPSTVTVHIRRLRGKIDRDPAQASRITTVWGHGYRFDTQGA
ncbi:response regulator transcription factor [Canibacter zhoujuaniae]|uniref:response regulator transcription factor n=1 Tax=Canibacter zhoujuaniae TaxID=2708343 RepID=UPI00141F707F|nr:response regulator transcription factor [Canibacter zhoujuaniae]